MTAPENSVVVAQPAKTEHQDNRRNADSPDVLLKRSQHVWCVFGHDCDICAVSLTTRSAPGAAGRRIISAITSS